MIIIGGEIIGDIMTETEKQLQDELIGLQIGFVEQERQIDKLSSVILKMQKDMSDLRKEIFSVKERLTSPEEGGEFNMEEERPPHY